MTPRKPTLLSFRPRAGASCNLLLVLVAFFASVNVSAQTVFVTRTGEKYHKDSCRYLSQSKIETTLAEAKSKVYAPCSVCKPPTTITTELIERDENSSDLQRATSTQCTGMTKSGKRCSRMTKASNGRCYQHLQLTKHLTGARYLGFERWHDRKLEPCHVDSSHRVNRFQIEALV